MAEVGRLESSESFATLAIWGFPTHGHRVVHQQMGCCRNDIWRNCLSGTICTIWAENSHCPRRPWYLEIHCFIRYPRYPRYPRISILGYLGDHEIPLLPRVFRVHVWGIHGIHPIHPHTFHLPAQSRPSYSPGESTGRKSCATPALRWTGTDGLGTALKALKIEAIEPEKGCFFGAHGHKSWTLCYMHIYIYYYIYIYERCIYVYYLCV